MHITIPSIFTLVATMGLSVAQANIWGPFDLGQDESIVTNSLNSDPAIEPPGEETAMGSTSESDEYSTKKPYCGDLCVLNLKFQGGKLSSLSFYPKKSCSPDEYNTRFRSQYKHLMMAHSDKYGLPLRSAKWPDIEKLKPGAIMYLHKWKVRSNVALRTGISKDSMGTLSLATTYVQDPTIASQAPAPATPDADDWSKVPEFYDLKKADVLVNKGIMAMNSRKGKEAETILREAAEMGSSRAYWALATLYGGGKGLPTDKAKAKECNEQAARLGYAMSAVSIDHNFDKAMKKLGMSAEDAKAVLGTVKRAAADGCVAEQFNLGVMYKNGFGVEKNPKLAKKWLSAAAEKGDKQAAAMAKSVK